MKKIVYRYYSVTVTKFVGRPVFCELRKIKSDVPMPQTKAASNERCSVTTNYFCTERDAIAYRDKVLGRDRCFSNTEVWA